jgi:hypothetical protein
MGRSFWSLTAKEAEYYNKPIDGWKEAIDRFPSAIIDIEEMNKCFALSRDMLVQYFIACRLLNVR